MTSRIDRLERRGLVTRLPDPNDRRGVLVGLTENGRKLLEDAVAASTNGERAVLGSLSENDVATLGQMLREILADLEPGLTGDD